MSQSVDPDYKPFEATELDQKLELPPNEYWDWIRCLDWDKIRHAAPKNDVRGEFADTLVYHEVLNEMLLFLRGNLEKNLDALIAAISKAFEGALPEEWKGQILKWVDDNREELNNLPKLSKPDIIRLLASMPLPDLEGIPKEHGPINVGIIGAGVSGLYAGRLFDWLNEYLETHPRSGDNGNLKYDFEILEASNRVGGRIYTHHFSPSKHDYYDVGAMRFPDTEIMKRTFDIFADVGLYKSDEDFYRAKAKAKAKSRGTCECNKVAKDDRPKQLLTYLMKSDRTPSYYNDIQHYKVPHGLPQKDKKDKGNDDDDKKKPKKHNLSEYFDLRREVEDAINLKGSGADDKDENKDIFHISTRNYGDVPYKFVKLGAEKLLKYAYDPFKYLMRYNFYVGYQALMKYETYSVREFLTRICGFDFYTINWLETSDSATGWFDLAFSEAVIESYTFDTPPVCEDNGEKKETGEEHSHEISPDTHWYCIEGGTSEFIRRLNDKVSGEPEYNRVVIGMKLDRNTDVQNQKMHVYLKDEADKPRKYHSVINTTTLGCASRMDLRNVELQTGQKAAIRMLRYSASTKIGIKFTDPWWTQEPFLINKGGVAPSDLYSTRMCVYPSYNINDPPNRPAVLLASYCWGQDAERVGSMMKKTSPDGEDILRDCLLRDLARLHHDKDAPAECKMGYDDVLKMLRKKYITHYSYDWNHDSFVSGAFAMFGPGQYRKMMPHLQRPTGDSRLHFVGEATSNHHAWIVGALESSLRAVCHILIKTGHWDLVDVLFKHWGKLPGFDKKIFFWQYVLGLLPPAQQATGQDINVKTVCY